MSSPEDEAWMAHAIALAQANVGRTGANPSVGCVIVKHGALIAEGVTAPGGRPHAEELALDRAGADARGATAYVTLEPCGERSSGMASCGQRLAEAGIARVVIACEDASIMAAGRGLKRLREAGVARDLGVLGHVAAGLYSAYRPRAGG